MTPQTLFVLTMAVCLAGSLLHLIGGSILFRIVFAMAPLWWPEVFGYYLSVLVYASSLLIATVTLMLSGVPAALYERWTGAQEATVASMAVWLASAVLLTLVGFAIGFA
ncbi:MAG: hypothetical protein NZ523_13740 [Elioraea sp.]|nr:hypothetical protein [Elioraea sp.]MDW8443776.1 hypothetical protein [Acetobacteraceae bacterium]